MAKINIAIVGILVLIAASLFGYSMYTSFQPAPPTSGNPVTAPSTPVTPTSPSGGATQPSAAETGCTGSGGTVGTSSCCQSAADFPNSCVIGACGCSPANSHDVKTCACPEGMCFSGSACVQQQQQLSITIYCTANNCAAQQINMGAGTLVQGCYRNLSDCQAVVKPVTGTVYCINNNCVGQAVPISATLAHGCYKTVAACNSAKPPATITIYCVSNNCSAQQVNFGAGTLVQGCYRNLSDCQGAIPPAEATIYCVNGSCSAQKAPANSNLPQGCYQNQSDCFYAQAATKTSCQIDSDCVPNECCHPTSCINKNFKTVCNLLCTQNCQGPLDCNAGSCKCVNSKCVVVPSSGY